MLAEDIKILNLLHPSYTQNSLLWRKFRFCYDGGINFVRLYLQKYSMREDENDFRRRKAITYSPSFAKKAINDIRNAICQRMPDITREGGPKSYLDAASGLNGGVNMQGSSMDLFMGYNVIPELLALGKVGIFVDMPSMIGPTIADKGAARPYIYPYKAEQIRAWTYDNRQPDKLLAVLLEDSNFVYDDKTGLTKGLDITYRHLWIQNGQVHVQFYDSNGDIKTPGETVLELDEIPFVMRELPTSLLIDAADYQIALLNLESSDLDYILKSNFPFYTEQFDARSESPYIKQGGIKQDNIFINQVIDEELVHDSGIVERTYDQTNEIQVGATSGRRYPVGTERPAFINPSSEPLQISMQKEEQLKQDIRQLVHLAVADLAPGKGKTGTETDSVEAGLSLIGLILESMERRVCEFWAKYEGSITPTHVSYPENYSLKSEEERRKEADDLVKLVPKLPSKTYQKEICKQIANITVGHRVSSKVMQVIEAEIDASEVVITDPDIIKTDLENGLVGTDLASKIRGYPAGQVEQAKKDHAERISRIAIAQTQGAGKEPVNPDARGTPDLSNNPRGAAEEKKTSRDTTLDPTPTDKTRGEGK